MLSGVLSAYNYSIDTLVDSHLPSNPLKTGIVIYDISYYLEKAVGSKRAFCTPVKITIFTVQKIPTFGWQV
jgi:hypothetical protein